MKYLMDEIKERYDFDEKTYEELEIIIDALAGIGTSEAEIKEQLKDYDIHLQL
jgi:hypothetical protein